MRTGGEVWAAGDVRGLGVRDSTRGSGSGSQGRERERDREQGGVYYWVREKGCDGGVRWKRELLAGAGAGAGSNRTGLDRDRREWAQRSRSGTAMTDNVALVVRRARTDAAFEQATWHAFLAGAIVPLTGPIRITHPPMAPRYFRPVERDEHPNRAPTALDVKRTPGLGPPTPPNLYRHGSSLDRRAGPIRRRALPSLLHRSTPAPHSSGSGHLASRRVRCNAHLPPLRHSSTRRASASPLRFGTTVRLPCSIRSSPVTRSPPAHLRHHSIAASFHCNRLRLPFHFTHTFSPGLLPFNPARHHRQIDPTHPPNEFKQYQIQTLPVCARPAPCPRPQLVIAPSSNHTAPTYLHPPDHTDWQKQGADGTSYNQKRHQ
ncbi:hypothetical protein AcV7_004728 [Taiwanofungus camphoratus]|nr:hypothetical protein AcV7_004728 [Antrodia cinnamomea]